ncbi:MAG: Mrp/NBP35 family ATP-binding protein [Deltaproteobacteria bacterium]|nr:Mrp/NBP35 family ATP-binding protein [Deltaproteobacteria bacterium]
MGSPTLDAVTEALRNVEDPIFEKPLGALGTLVDARLEDGRVWAKIRVSSPSAEVRQTIQTRAEAALAPLGVEFVELELELNVPTREATSTDPIPEVRNVVLVMSGKGGVGKSTVATNLALSLRRLGTRVGLLDADIYGPSLPTMLGIEGHPTSKDGKRIQPLQRFGIKLMSIGFLLEDPKQAIVWRGPMLHGALQQFVSDVDWGPLDYLIIDSPPGTGDVALTLAQKLSITGAIMVTTPQEVALQDVYKSVSMCQKLDVPILGVVENMSHFIDSAGVKHELFGSGGGEKIAEFAGAPLFGQVPLDALVREWGDQGTPIVQAAPASVAGQAFAAIADALAERIAKEHFDRSGGETAPRGEGPKRLRILS